MNKFLITILLFVSTKLYAQVIFDCKGDRFSQDEATYYFSLDAKKNDQTYCLKKNKKIVVCNLKFSVKFFENNYGKFIQYYIYDNANVRNALLWLDVLTYDGEKSTTARFDISNKLIDGKSQGGKGFGLVCKIINGKHYPY